jgi:hypothetical protein
MRESVWCGEKYLPGQQYSEEMSLPDLTKTIGLLFMALLVGLVEWQMIERI